MLTLNLTDFVFLKNPAGPFIAVATYVCY